MGMSLASGELERIRDRVRLAKKKQKKEAEEKRKRLIKLFEGNQHEKVAEKKDRITSNHFLPKILIKVAAIAYNPPSWVIRARREEYQGAAELWTSILPYLWREISVTVHTRAALLDAQFGPIGVVKIGYRFETRKKLIEGMRPSPDVMIPEEILFDNPFVERVSPKDFVIDPEVDYLSWPKAKFMAQRLIIPLEDVKRNPEFKNTESLKADSVMEKDYADDADLKLKTGDEYKADIQRVTVWEYHDASEGRIIYFANGHDEPLLVKEYPYIEDSNNFPFEILHSIPVPDKFYTVAPGELMESQQAEKNLLRSRMATKARRAVGKLVVTGTMDDAAKRAMQSDEEGAVAFASQGTTVNAVNIPDFSRDIYQYDNLINEDMNLVYGTNEYEQGILPDEKRTATEASMLQSLSGIRKNMELQDYEDFCSRVARKLMARGKQFFDFERIVRVTGDEGAQYWRPYTKEDIQGEFDTEVEYGSTQFSNQALQRKQFMDFYSIAKSNPLINQVELTKELLKKFDQPIDKLLVQQPASVPVVLSAAGQNTVNPTATEDTTGPMLAQIQNMGGY
ncbi:MAG: portal protein [Bacillota bacterium]